MALVVKDDSHMHCEENGEENGPSKVFQKLYDLEKRVEALRDQALSIEQEKVSVLASLQGIQDNDWLLTVSAVTNTGTDATDEREEKEEIEANAERLVCRCLTVEINVTTPRNEIQEKALDRVKNLVQEVENELSFNTNKALLKAKSYLNACLTAECNTMDHRFQGILLDCTADDQKSIKKQLQMLIEKHERIDKDVV